MDKLKEAIDKISKISADPKSLDQAKEKIAKYKESLENKIKLLRRDHKSDELEQAYEKLKYVNERLKEISKNAIKNINKTSPKEEKVKSKNTRKAELIYFYRPSCGACRANAETADKLKKHFSNKTVKLRQVNTEINRSLPMEFGVEYVPALFLVTKNGERIEYRGSNMGTLIDRIK